MCISLRGGERGNLEHCSLAVFLDGTEMWRDEKQENEVNGAARGKNAWGGKI